MAAQIEVHECGLGLLWRRLNISPGWW